VLTRKEYAFRLHLRGYQLSEADPMDFRRLSYPVLESSVLPMPVISQSLERFDRPMMVSLSSSVDKAEIHYTTDGTTPDEKSPLYKKPFSISQSTLVQAKTFKKGYTTSFAASKRFNFDYITENQFERKPSTPYNYNQESLLFDGETGSITDLSQGWLGFKDDMTALFTLSKTIDLQDVVMHFAHVPDAWAFAPTQVMVYVSSDGQNWSEPIRAKIKYEPGDQSMNTPQLQTIKIAVDKSDVRYVKVVAKSLARIPEWHKAKGLKPWLMIDEVQLNEVIK
ncbi:MAG: chitobiase/beta-hexosaminidase C-terminal domain-containing protein, partial [Bacteroidales bacterium]|nr:chitobiase/beta-hexosaminidase C-terminal domain-containing protein [Bacteroidales bacterium]